MSPAIVVIGAPAPNLRKFSQASDEDVAAAAAVTSA